MNTLPDCPVCGAELIPYEEDHVRLDHKPECVQYSYILYHADQWSRLAKLLADGLAVKWLQVGDPDDTNSVYVKKIFTPQVWGGQWCVKMDGYNDGHHEAPTLHEAVQKARGQ